MFLESESWILLSGQDQELIETKIQAILKDNKKNKKRFSSDRNIQVVDSEDSIRCGYRAEFALSKYMNLTWSNEHIGNYDKPDLEFGIEVKASDNPNGNLYCSQKHLEVYLKRSLNTPVACAITACYPWVEFHGFLFAKELTRYPFIKPGFRGNSGYLAKRTDLHSMAKFKELVEYWKTFSALNKKEVVTGSQKSENSFV